MNPRLVDALLDRADREIALVDRARPLDYAATLASLVAAWERGAPRAPAWRYRRPPALGDLRRALAAVAESSDVDPLHAARAAELALEAEAAELIGRPAFAAAAARRFPAPPGAEGARTSRLAQAWSRELAEPDEPALASDDEREPGSLVGELRRELGARRLPFRVEVSRELASLAATGADVVLVRAGARLGPRAVRRIVLHEVVGHAEPRHRARSAPLGLFRFGAAGGADDEEGRALLLERRAELLDAGRRAELGRRHLAALSVREGASFSETVELLRARGAPLTPALALSARVHRGGGLARELVYLPALERVERALAAEPTLEPWLERGRVGLAAARALATRAGLSSPT
ncbi:MAG: DUF1704 domain-containing protein [Sorangiineae bacterium]|nr:DUF1704 domain-containing protein [Polyangiaceae bacterium]MEB2321063.1 DUF1704 domain-containing protein [Sorangiineae bacterium]